MLAVAVGGVVIDLVGGGQGVRDALWIGVILMGVGALLLRPVDERRREISDDPTPVVVLSEPATPLA